VSLQRLLGDLASLQDVLRRMRSDLENDKPSSLEDAKHKLRDAEGLADEIETQVRQLRRGSESE
jgi:hypothetical protein